MKIRMKTTAAGPQGVLAAGIEYDVADGLGEALCSGGYAARIKSAVPAPVPVRFGEYGIEPADETADAEPVIERAVTRGRGKR